MDKPLIFKVDAERYPNIMQTAFDLQAVGGWECVFRKVKEKRSISQNSILWAWHGEMAEWQGETVEKVHNRFKYRFVLPILLVELGGQEGDHLRQLYEVISLHGPEALEAFCDRAVSSTLLSVKQFSKALDDYDRWAASNGCIFQKRGPDYDLALGVKGGK